MKTRIELIKELEEYTENRELKANNNICDSCFDRTIQIIIGKLKND